MSFSKPWRTVSEKAPEEAAIQIDAAIRLAILTGDASNRVEAMECLAANYLQEKQMELIEHARQHHKVREDDDRGSWEYRAAQWIAWWNAGWRCLLCGRSRDLHTHHGVPKGQRGTDDESNLYPVCWKCHNRITTATAEKDAGWVWFKILPLLKRLKEARKREFNTNGWVFPRDETWRIAYADQCARGADGELDPAAYLDPGKADSAAQAESGSGNRARLLQR